MLLKILNKIPEVLKLRLCIKTVKIRLSVHAHEIKITRYVMHLFGHLEHVPSKPRLEISHISKASSIGLGGAA